MPKPPENLRDFSSLVKVVENLRGPDGCPWDKEQTHRSLTPYALEEACELAEAIESGDSSEMVSELGDLLLQVVLHAEIARQEGVASIEDVVESINQKMIRRHPHVFSNTEVSGSDEVLKNWDQIKAQEKAAKPLRDGEFEVPRSLPALSRSYKIGKKTKKTGFDWQEPTEVFAKLTEEYGEVKEVLDNNGSQEELEHEIGDLLFATAQLARHLKIDPEQALRATNQRFEKRYAKMLDYCDRAQKSFLSLSTEEKEELWKRAKKEETDPV